MERGVSDQEIDPSDPRPVVIFVEGVDLSISQQNPARDALAYVIEHDHCCRIILFGYVHGLTESHFEPLQQLNSKVLAAIIKQDEYGDDHIRYAAFIRQAVNPNLPVVFIPERKADNIISPVDSNCFIYHHDDQNLLKLIAGLRANYQSQENIALTVSQLSEAYHALHSESLGTPNHREQNLIQALRIRLSPSEVRHTEFEDVLDAKLPPIDKPPNAQFQRELNKIRTLTPEEHFKFEDDLLFAEGYKRQPDGGLLRIRTGLGNTVAGFAADPHTLQQLITCNFAEHYLAGEYLTHKLGHIESLRRGESFHRLPQEIMNQIGGRIITGLLLLKIPGYSTPILRLQTTRADPTSLRKIAHRVIESGLYIPVDDQGKLIE